MKSTYRNLHDETIAAINKAIQSKTKSLTLLKIAKDCDVSYRWLLTFKAGESPEAGVSKVQRVYNYLTKKDSKQ